MEALYLHYWLVPISGEHFPDIFCSRQFLLTALALFGHRRTTERPLVHPFFPQIALNKMDPWPHRYTAPMQDMGIPEAGRYPCASYAKVSAPLAKCCTRRYHSKQSTCVRVDEKGPLTRCDTERPTADQSLQNRRDMRPRYAMKLLFG